MKILESSELDRIIYGIDSFNDKLKLHQHELAVRLELERLRKATELPPIVIQQPAEPEAAAIVRWLREEFLVGREGTVRGDFGLKIASLIEDGAFRKKSD